MTRADWKWVYYTSNDRKADSYAVYRYDLAADRKEPLFSEDGLWEIADHREEAAETRLLLQKATGALSSEIYEWGTRGRTLRPLLGQGETTEFRVGYGADPQELLVLTNKLGDFRRLYRWKPQGGLTPVTGEMKMDVSGFRIDEARRRVYYTLNEGGYTRLRVLDARTLEPRPFPEMKDADHVYAGTPSRAGRYVTIGVETSRAPPATYGYGKPWLDPDTGPKRLRVIPDIADAGKYAREHYARGGRAPKVAITGGSYGGYPPLVGMTMFAGTYDAGASIVGFSSLLTFLNN